MISRLWLRRDLRVHDHQALLAAAAGAEHLVPVFCFDDRLLHGRHSSRPRTQFLLECIEARVHPGLFAADDLGAIRSARGTPYTVFTPFYRAWSAAGRRAVAPAPRSLPPLAPGLDAGTLPALAALKLRQELEDPMPGGERAGRERMRQFMSAAVARYATDSHMPGRDGVSRLSPYLHLGCVSARELEQLATAGEGPAAFRRQLCWRDSTRTCCCTFPPTRAPSTSPAIAAS